jgi:hypothetical protein
MGDLVISNRSVTFTTIICVIGLTLSAFPNSTRAQEHPTVRLVDDADAHEFVIEVGPVDLHPGEGESHHTAHMGVYLPIETVTIPFDAYLPGFRYEIVDKDGRQLPRELLHHINITDPDHRELFLPISRRMFAASKETGEMKAPGWLVGIPVSKGQRWVVSAMLHNPTPEHYEGVSVRYHLPYVKAGHFWPLIKVVPWHMDVAFPAGSKAFDVPPGRHTWSWEGSPSIPGRLMAVSSHFHEYVENITLKDLTTGDLLWEGCPIYNEEGHLQGVTVGRFYRRLGKRIYTDHTYQVAVTYNNPTGAVIPNDGMGVAAGIFAPDDYRSWPKVDKSDPLYQVDRAHYMHEVEGRWADLASAVPGGDELERIARLPDAQVRDPAESRCHRD